MMTTYAPVIITSRDKIEGDSFTELGNSVRAKFNEVADVLDQHDFHATQYIFVTGSLAGALPSAEYDSFKSSLDQKGFDLRLG